MSLVIEAEACRKFVTDFWKTEVTPSFEEFLKIPNISPEFDASFCTNGLIDNAMKVMKDFAEAQKIDGLKAELHTAENRGPLLFIEIPAFGGYKGDGSVLLYGHADKMPPVTDDWTGGKKPYEPFVDGEFIFGRGTVDDGYSFYSCLAAVIAVREQGKPHPRCVFTIESGEESGSPDLPFYLDKLAKEIEPVSLAICADSGCWDYSRLWLTPSLRGVIMAKLHVSLLNDPVHSGESGMIASSFRVARMLLNRIEDVDTGAVHKGVGLDCDIPPHRLQEAKQAAERMGDSVWNVWPYLNQAGPVTKDGTELLLNRSWRPALSVTAAGGMPPIDEGGNVLRTYTDLLLSIRIPPSVDPKAAGEALKKLMEENPPYGATVELTVKEAAGGWDSKPNAPWLDAALEASSTEFFGAGACSVGEGGSIPVVADMGERYPNAQFLVSGVLAPDSNAHGPNENLHIPSVMALTMCFANIIAAVPQE